MLEFTDIEIFAEVGKLYLSREQERRRNHELQDLFVQMAQSAAEADPAKPEEESDADSDTA